LSEIRERAASERAMLSPELRALAPADPAYPVAVSTSLSDYQEAVRRALLNGASWITYRAITLRKTTTGHISEGLQ
jgi:hypothetical protein